MRLHDDTKADLGVTDFDNIKWMEERHGGIHLHVWVHELTVTKLYLATHGLHMPTHAHAHAHTYTYTHTHTHENYPITGLGRRLRL